MQPEDIFQHNELSQVPNEKCLQEVHPILPTGKINHLIPRCSVLHVGPAPDLDLPKKKMFFAAWERSGSSLKISWWDSEFLIFTKYLCSLKLVYHRPGGVGAVRDILLHLCHEQLNMKWVQGIPVFIFNMSSLWQHYRAARGGLLKWDLVSPHREGSVVRSDATSSPEGKSSVTISMCTTAFTSNWRASGYGFY